MAQLKKNGVCKLRYNDELDKLYNEPDIVKLIKVGHLGWVGYLSRSRSGTFAGSQLYVDQRVLD
jgi:hypothetical protein